MHDGEHWPTSRTHPQLITGSVRGSQSKSLHAARTLLSAYMVHTTSAGGSVVVVVTVFVVVVVVATHVGVAWLHNPSFWQTAMSKSPCFT